MTIKRRYRINKLRLREVSLVPEGDNPGAEVLISKARETGQGDVEIIKGRLAEAAELAGELIELAAGEGGDEGIVKAARILGGMNMDNLDQLNERLEQIEADLTTVSKAKDDAEARATKAEADLATATAEIAKMKKGSEAEGDDEDVLKGLPQAVRDRLEKAEKLAQDASEEISKARDQRDLDVAIEKVKGLGVKDPDGLGAVLHRISKGKSTPEDGEKVLEMITIAKAVGDKGNALFEAIGVAKGKDAGGSEAEVAQGKLDEAVEAIQKAKPALTKEQAYSEALDANPELYEQINKRHPKLVAAE